MVMAPRIENVEDWLGQAVTGPEGEKIGKLEDIVFAGDGTPLLGAVTTGLLGRRTSLVPLADAKLSPDRIAVPYSKAEVKEAPQIDDPTAMTTAVEDETTGHYGRALRDRDADERYDTAGERLRRAAEAAAADTRATELEQHAERLGAQAAEARAQATLAADQATRLEREHEAAAGDATEARAAHAALERDTPPLR
jgi:phage protein D